MDNVVNSTVTASAALWDGKAHQNDGNGYYGTTLRTDVTLCYVSVETRL